MTAVDEERFRDLKHPDLARGPGVHDGRRTEPCSCVADGAEAGWEAGYGEDANWSPEHPAEWHGERIPGDGLIRCGRCGGDAWVYIGCTRCDGSGAEPAGQGPPSAVRDLLDDLERVLDEHSCDEGTIYGADDIKRLRERLASANGRPS